MLLLGQVRCVSEAHSGPSWVWVRVEPKRLAEIERAHAAIKAIPSAYGVELHESRLETGDTIPDDWQDGLLLNLDWDFVQKEFDTQRVPDTTPEDEEEDDEDDEDDEGDYAIDIPTLMITKDGDLYWQWQDFGEDALYESSTISLAKLRDAMRQGVQRDVLPMRNFTRTKPGRTGPNG